MLAGIDLGGTKIEACLFDDDLVEQARKRVPTPRSYPGLLDALVDQHRWLVAESGIGRLPLGIGIPGIIEAETGLSMTSNLAAMRKPLRADLSVRLGFDVLVKNDCKCFALSEANGGAGADFETVFGLILGTGCGGGLCHNGRLVEGFNGLPGEVGHTGIPFGTAAQYDLPLRQCNCGREGCFETLVSGPGMSALARSLKGADLQPEEIVAGAAAGDADLEAVLNVWLHLACELIRNIQATVDPNCIVLGGGLSRVAGIERRLQTTLPEHVVGGTRPPEIRIQNSATAAVYAGRPCSLSKTSDQTRLCPSANSSIQLRGPTMTQSIQKSPEGLVLVPSGWLHGRVVCDGENIVRIEGEPARPEDHPNAPYILPGFVDLHVHGAEGVDYSSGEDGIRHFIRYHASNGTIALAPTTSTSPVEVIETALRNIETIRHSPGAGEPQVIGAHLEGPFINPGKLGAQRDLTLEGDADLLANGRRSAGSWSPRSPRKYPAASRSWRP